MSEEPKRSLSAFFNSSLRNVTPQSSVSTSSTASATFSLDHFSGLARRASNSSIQLLNAGAAALLQSHTAKADEQQRMVDKVQQVTDKLVTTLNYACNDYTLGLYRVSEHIHRKTPHTVNSKKQLRHLKELVDTANADITDAHKMVEDMARIESFHRMGEMIKTSLNLVKEAKKRSSTK